MGGKEKRLAGDVNSVCMKCGVDHAVLFSSMFDVLPSISFRSSATILEAEKRNGMPKLDSGAMGTPLELAKVGGGAHVEHFILDCFTACTISSSGLDFSLDSVILLPSSHETWIAVAFSEALTHLVVRILAWAWGVRVAALPVWHTPPWSVVEVPGTGAAGLSDLYLY
jgi:hypothetical protein